MCLGVEIAGADGARSVGDLEEDNMMSAPRVAAAAAAIFLCGSALSTPTTQSQTFTVDCAKGQTISAALERGNERKLLVVIVRGTCNENVTIERENVTLQGDPQVGGTVNGAANANTINILASPTTIDRLTVAGGLNGIRVYGAFSVGISNSVIRGASQSGILLVNSHASIVDNTIENVSANGVHQIRFATARLIHNQIRSNAGVGILAEQNSTVSTNGNSVTANGAQGILLLSGSQGALSGDTVGSNGTNPTAPASGIDVNFSNAQIGNVSILNNGRAGILAAASVVSVTGSTITGNQDSGVLGFLSSTFNISGTISNNGGDGVQLILNSTAQITPGTIIQGNQRHGIELAAGSKLWLPGAPITSGGNAWYGLWCNDTESSVNTTSALVYSPPNGVGTSSCTGF